MLLDLGVKIPLEWQQAELKRICPCAAVKKFRFSLSLFPVTFFVRSHLKVGWIVSRGRRGGNRYPSGPLVVERMRLLVAGLSTLILSLVIELVK